MEIENFFEDTTTYPVEVLPFFDGIDDEQTEPCAFTFDAYAFSDTLPVVSGPRGLNVQRVIECPCCQELQERTRWCRSCGIERKDRDVHE